jgi:uncharacterized protein YegJ (DUF2314 family)
MRILFGIAAFASLSTNPSHAMDADTVISIPANDRGMAAAIAKARQSFRQFIDTFSHPKPGQNAFLVKMAFDSPSGTEHLWLADLDLSAAKPTGVIADVPTRPDLQFKQRVEIDFTRLSDWMYVEDGKLVGGYTIRLLRERMTPAERKEADAAMPFRIEDETSPHNQSTDPAPTSGTAAAGQPARHP